MSENRIDPVTGTETTGHQWDGIEELNNPLPRWWLWTFYATVVWGIGYCLLFPAWPLLDRATAGWLGWSTRAEVAAEIAAHDQAQAGLRQALVAADLETLPGDDALHRFAVQAGGAVFRTSCAQCHGAGAAGFAGYPNLLDDDWLWGGSLTQIADTIRHGIRDDSDPETRWSAMPAFAEMLPDEEIAALADHLRALPGGADPLGGPAGALYEANCASCHGLDARGDRQMGAPNLADRIWLYDPAKLEVLIAEGPYGVMPAWGARLGESDLRAVAAYVHQLGGGERPEELVRAAAEGAADPSANQAAN